MADWAIYIQMIALAVFSASAVVLLGIYPVSNWRTLSFPQKIFVVAGTLSAAAFLATLIFFR